MPLSARFLALSFFRFPIAQPPFKTGISIDSPDRPHTLQTLASCSPLPEEVPSPYNDRSGFQCLTGDRSLQTARPVHL
ncbi:MAG: hypothetical protein JGK24_18370 [Microcoleus sp. PH2017_29_MFU_D_A]|uniref:hypothetical protein n=1 Tax=unclassified Microcoleus TaxID=2642155 RepID=UPI001D5DD5CF|nr:MULTISPECIES: hypothetical protein [unclassified Microcoleus]MCC3491009.1 hypothetical protein [Microcoleus sp. PH2017_16_JOR_D_A]MCC3573039.1 hypothetical protein [Microcoleus sp. PH2017_34_RAT_O_A]MCC3583703.1 hypothetical protein [Microcoleus sp. PH2017_30_WIL_O_A]MCC3605134.1 hypothetical protein [Microcoleus sp. PH2017_29_MFU_D_A]MCC3610486.1 hypothetical protein [Microcoleus sp. PH2017_40_RAT_O_B]